MALPLVLCTHCTYTIQVKDSVNRGELQMALKFLIELHSTSSSLMIKYCIKEDTSLSRLIALGVDSSIPGLPGSTH